MTKKYLSNLFKTYQKGDAREESYYEHLTDFLRLYSQVKRKKKIDVTILPKKTEAGNPDFRIWDGRKIGYFVSKKLKLISIRLFYSIPLSINQNILAMSRSVTANEAPSLKKFD